LSFGLTKIPFLQIGFEQFINWAYGTADTLCRHGFPSWSASYIGNAITSICIELIPILALFIAFGYGLLGMGLKTRYWKLTFVLLALTAIFGLSFHQSYPLYQYPILKTLILFLIQIFINGLPEELFFRGFLLPRFESILKSPVNALVITSLLFNASHFASIIANGNSIPIAILNVFNVWFPSGLLWGYLYQRTRSIVPGILFHTSFGILGAYFFNF
jgi:membrane protease YdiL (CAAX protease family)